MQNYRDKDLELDIKKLPKGYRVASDEELKQWLDKFVKKYDKLLKDLAKV